MMKALPVALAALLLAVPALAARGERTPPTTTIQTMQCPPGWGCWSYPESGDSIDQGHAFLMVPPGPAVPPGSPLPSDALEAVDC